MIAGLDASNVNGTLDWPSLARQHSLSFVFLKATEGTGFRDALFPAAWKATGALGLVRGAYHFAHPGQDAHAQAEAFLSYVRAAGLEDHDLLALDLEVTDGRAPAAVSAWAQEFCSAVQAGSGRSVLVYTFISFAEAGNCAGLGSHPLWIADPSSAPGSPRVPGPWKTWAVHQYGQQGLDLDMANFPAKSSMRAALGRPAKVPAEPAKPATQGPRQWVTAGQDSLHDLAQAHGGLPSTVLRLTAEHSPGGEFTPEVASWLNDVFAGRADAAKPVPKGLRLFLPG